MQLVVVIIGLVTVLVLLEQAKAAKRQWRVAVWDRRYEVYKATIELVENIVRWNGPTKEQVEEWERRARDREWLFGADLNDIVSDMERGWGRLVGMGEAVDEANAEGDVKRAKELAEEGKNLHQWFEEKKQKVVESFGEYLAVKEK